MGSGTGHVKLVTLSLLHKWHRPHTFPALVGTMWETVDGLVRSVSGTQWGVLSALQGDRPQAFFPHEDVLCWPMTRLWLTGILFVNLLRAGLFHSHGWLVCLLCFRIIDFLFVFFLLHPKEIRTWKQRNGGGKMPCFYFSLCCLAHWQSPDCHQKPSLFWGVHQVTN